MSQIHITRAVHKATKKTISVNNVQSGLQDNIVCACCGGKLVANKGKKNAWSFSHHSDKVCTLAYETQLHLTAKEYFAREGWIPMPLNAGWVSSDLCSELNISSVKVEVYMDGRRPDLIVEIGTEQYWIEIANKHKCEADKIWECRANSRNVIEIDVSNAGHLDKFDSLQHCLVRIQSINHCNDYLDEIARSSAIKHEKVRKQFENITRSQQQLEVEKDKQEKAEKTLEQRREIQKKKHEEKLEHMKLLVSAQDEILAELKHAIEAHQLLFNKMSYRKENLESEISEQVSARLKELNLHNAAALEVLKGQLISEWQQEIIQERVQLKQELIQEREQLEQELERQFQLKVNLMEELQQKYDQTLLDLKKSYYEKDSLVNEIKNLSLKKNLFIDDQAKLFKEKLEPLIQKNRDLEKENDHLEKIQMHKFEEIGLIDTYAKNMKEVSDFCLARSDYRSTLSQRAKKLEMIENKYQNLSDIYDEKYERLDVIIKLMNVFDDFIRNSLVVIDKEKFIDLFPEKLVKRLKSRPIIRSKTAKEELDDYDMGISSI